MKELDEFKKAYFAAKDAVRREDMSYTGLRPTAELERRCARDNALHSAEKLYYEAEMMMSRANQARDIMAAGLPDAAMAKFRDALEQNEANIRQKCAEGMAKLATIH